MPVAFPTTCGTSFDFSPADDKALYMGDYLSPFCARGRVIAYLRGCLRNLPLRL